MQLVTSTQRRTTTTPNAVMTTLASPTLGEAATAVWLVDMPAGSQGPEHAFESEVVWSLTDGQATLRVGGEEHALEAGDTVVMPGGEQRRFTAGPDGFSAVVVCHGDGEVVRGDGESAGTPPWVS